MRSLEKIQCYDHKLFYWLTRPKYHNLLLPLSKSLSFTANGPGYVLAGVMLALLGHSEITALLALGFCIERSAYFTFKPTFKRARPAAALPNFASFITPSDQFSFPSGHTSGAFLFASIIGHFLPGCLLPLLLWASCVGLSRVLLGVHFVTDILAGAAMGASIAAILLGYTG